MFIFKNSPLIVISVWAMSITGCKTATSSPEADLNAAKTSKEKRFVCTLETDSTSKKFRPKQMTDAIQVTIVTNTIKNVSMEIGPKGQVPAKTKLKSISGDEGYTEFSVDDVTVKKYGFEYVNVSYDEEDESTEPTHASLIHGGDFAVCNLKDK